MGQTNLRISKPHSLKGLSTSQPPNLSPPKPLTSQPLYLSASQPHSLMSLKASPTIPQPPKPLTSQPLYLSASQPHSLQSLTTSQPLNLKASKASQPHSLQKPHPEREELVEVVALEEPPLLGILEDAVDQELLEDLPGQ